LLARLVCSTPDSCRNRRGAKASAGHLLEVIGRMTLTSLLFSAGAPVGRIIEQGHHAAFRPRHTRGRLR
jgi:hypothetical protein